MSVHLPYPLFRFLVLASFALVSAMAQQAAKPELQIATGHAERSSGQLVIAEEKLLITTAGDGEVKAWDLITGKVLKNWSMPKLSGLPLYVKDRGWLVFNVGRYIEIYQTSDLSKVTSIKRDRTETPAYDPFTKGVFITEPTIQGLKVLEYDFDKKYFERRALLPNPPRVGNKPAPQLSARRILPLGDGRLLLELGGGRGIAIVDATDWSKVDMRPEETRRFELGRPGELISITKGRTVEVVDSHTFALLRSAEMARAHPTDTGNLFFSDFTVAKPGRPEQLVVRGSSVRFLDPQTLQVTRQLDVKKDLASLNGYLTGLALVQGDEWLLTTSGGLFVVNLHESRVVQTLGVETLPVARLAVAPEGFRFFISNGEKKTSRRVDFTNEGVNLTAFDGNPVNMKYSPDGRFVAFQRPGERVVRLSSSADFPNKPRLFNRTKAVPLPEQANFVFSPDSRFLAVLSAKTTHIYELATGRLVLEPTPGFGASSSHSNEGFGSFSPDGNTFAHNIHQRKEGDSSARGWIRAYDLTTATPLWEKPSADLVLCYSPDGRDILTINPQNKYIRRFNAATGEEGSRRDIAGSGGPIVSWSLSADGTRFLFAKDRDIRVIELAGFEGISFHTQGSPVEYARFFANHNFFITLSADGHVRLWKSGQAFPLATLVLFANGKDWSLYTPDFQFQASPGGMDEVYFVKGRSVIPLESLFEQFFTPGLVPRLLAGETLQPAIDVAKIKIPPSVTLALDTGTRGLAVEDDIAVVKSTEAQVKISVQATSPDAAISEIRLYQNGKLVQATTRGLFVEDDPDALIEKRTFPLTLLPGENTFRAVAINAQRVESLPAELVVKFSPPGVGPVVAGAGDAGSGLQLHLVIVGLNKYRNPRFNLNYAVADATAVREHIEKRAAGIFTKINTHVIFDDQAVKPAILAAFQKIAATAGPRDAFIFYYAGHGVMSGEDKPKFYLVPYDVTQMYGADEKLATSAISSVELQELSRLIPAQKQLFVLDACQSAGALEAIAVRGAAEQKAIAQLARSSGTHWLTASGSEQFATEFAELGHGAFTYVLLQGLAGKADSGDGRVTVNELKAWLESELPEVTQKHKGTPQFPASYGFGQDFPLTIRN